VVVGRDRIARAGSVQSSRKDPKGIWRACRARGGVLGLVTEAREGRDEGVEF
jgi:hypothetical protein